MSDDVENNNEKAEATQIPCKEMIFQRDNIEIYYDDDYKVIVACKGERTNDILKAKEIVTEINILPMNEKVRKFFGKEIANIYQIAYNSNWNEAQIFGKKILKNIEEYIITCKKIEFIIPSVISTLICIIGANIFKTFFECDYIDGFIYGPIGGILSVIINQKDIKIDYKVETYILVIEAVKMIFVSVLVSIIGIIAIKSKFIFSNIDFESNIYMTYLLLIICGYSQSFIPNLLAKLTSDIV